MSIGVDAGIWLDSVRAVPSIGVRFTHSFETTSTLISKLKPTLSKWQAKHPALKVSTSAESVIKIERPDGVEMLMTPEQVTCKFYYLSTLVERGQVQPVMKYDCEPLSFREMSDRVQEALFDLLGEIFKDGNRNLKFIGFVAEGNLDPDGLPPGFEKYIARLGALWPLGLVESKSNLIARLARSESVIDRCHHQIEVPPEAEDVVVKFKLDWQRVWNNFEAVPVGKVKSHVVDVRVAALNYFGEFGLGDLNYAERADHC